MFSTTLTTGTGFPGSRISITRDPVLGLRSRPPWRTASGSLRSSFETFTLFPCYGAFGCTSNPTHPVRSNGPARIVRCVLVASTGVWYSLPSHINFSALRGVLGCATPRRPHETGGEPPRLVRKESPAVESMHDRSDSAAGPVTGQSDLCGVGIQTCRPNSRRLKLRRVRTDRCPSR